MEKKELEQGEWIENIGSIGIWLPKTKGEEMEGVVHEVKQGTYGIQVTVKDKNEEIITTPSHKMLQARLGNIQVGDKIKITYEGTELPKVKGQQPTRLYKVFVRRIEEVNV